jgi:hypothetical protein
LGLLLFIAVLIILLSSFQKWELVKFKAISAVEMQFIFLLKIAVMFTGIYFFSDYKGYGESSDIYSFFNAATRITKNVSLFDQFKIIFQITPSKETTNYLNHLTYWNKDFDYGLPNDNQTMIKFSLFLNGIGLNNYHTQALISTYISFVGVVIIFKSLYILSKQTLIHLLFITLSPTLLFFCSGIYKESILIFYIGILIRILISRRKLIYTGLFILIYSLYPIKPYFFLIITPAVILYVFTKKINFRISILFNSALYIGLFFTLVLYSSFQEKNITKDDVKYGKVFDPIKMITYKQDDFLDDAIEKKSKLTKTVKVLEKNNSHVYSAIPIGMYCGWLQPSLFNFSSKSFLLFSIEYTILFILMILFFIQIIRRKIFFNNELAFMLTICIVYCTFIGMTSPIIGNLIRFKTPIMPFMYCMISQINFKRLL